MSKPVDHSKAYREVKRQKSQREKEKRERERKSRESQESVDGGRHGSGRLKTASGGRMRTRMLMPRVSKSEQRLFKTERKQAERTTMTPVQ